MTRDYDDRVLGYWGLTKLKQDDKWRCETDMKNTVPLFLGGFIFSNSRGIMINFLLKIFGFKTKKVYYTDTEKYFNEKKP